MASRTFKDRATVLDCSNATCTRKTRLNVTGEVLIHGALNRRKLFLAWYEKFFTPEAKAQFLLVGLDPRCKTVLLFDNHSSHQNADLLVKDVYLSHSAVGILRFITCKYRSDYMHCLLFADVEKFLDCLP